MTSIGFVLPDEHYGYELNDSVDIAVNAENAGFHSIWKSEIAGSNGFMTLSAVAQATDNIKLGTGIANVFSRSPTLLGMSIATLDRLSGGRAIAGLGVSSKPIVEEWHGMEFEQPLRRMYETIQILRQFESGQTIDFNGEIFDIGPYSAGVTIKSNRVPIYNAAMGETNRRLTAEHADGWVPVNLPFSKLPSMIDELSSMAERAGRDQPTIAAQIPIAIDEDRTHAEQRVRDHIAQEMGMGYNRLLRKFGYGESADKAHKKWRNGNRDAAAAVLPQDLVDDLGVYGTADECRETVRAFYQNGVDTVILWPSFTACHREIDAIIDSFADFDQ